MFLFIHGFNVSFEDALTRTAQIAYDLRFPGVPILYSWPSKATIQGYFSDIDNVEWSLSHFEQFLKDVQAKTKATTIHLIAHSMGNRLVIRALDNFRLSGEGKKFSEVLLTAPDVDSAVFKQFCERIYGQADRLTMYASANDRALAAARKLTSYPQAGDSSSGIVIADHLDSIDASAVDTDFVGHSYYGDSLSVLSDIFYLVRTRLPPDQRFGLHKEKIGSEKYWIFSP